MPPRIIMTRELAFTCAFDSGTASMLAAGRTAWNLTDYRVALATFARLCPDPSITSLNAITNPNEETN